MAKYYERSKRGQAKYGTNLDRKDVDLTGWLNHLQEELMDATLYIEKLKKDSTELQKMLESSTKPEDIEAAKKRIEDAVASKVTNLETENSNLKGLVKTLRVTNDAMKLHSTHFVEKSEAEIEGLVNRFCDWDEKSGQVVVKDKNGEIRYSKTKGGQFMSVEEYFEEIKTERPYLAKSSNNTGSMSGSANSANSGNSAGISKGSLPPGVTDKASMKAYFEKNPEVLQDYLNGRLN